MKILFVIGGLIPGGKERRLISLLKKLVISKDFEIELIILNKDIHYKEVLNIGFKNHIIDRTNLLKIQVYNKISSIEKKFQPDIIHSWDSLTTLYSIPLRIRGKSKLITSRITNAQPKYKKISKDGLLSELCFFFSDFILANSKAGLLAYKVSNKKSKVIYNGFDFDRLHDLKPKSELKQSIGIGKEFVVSMVASFSEKKDFQTFLKAAQEILLKRNDTVFLCVGEGVLREKLEKMNQNESIIFLGERNDVESLINISDVGVLMSNNKKHGEGISNSLLEFMAQGKPVIVSNNGGNKELVLHNETGYILETNNYKELANKLIKLLSDEKKAKEMGISGKKRVKEAFEIDRMVTEFVEVYKEVLNK